MGGQWRIGKLLNVGRGDTRRDTINTGYTEGKSRLTGTKKVLDTVFCSVTERTGGGVGRRDGMGKIREKIQAGQKRGVKTRAIQECKTFPLVLIRGGKRRDAIRGNFAQHGTMRRVDNTRTNKGRDSMGGVTQESGIKERVFAREVGQLFLDARQ